MLLGSGGYGTDAPNEKREEPEPKREEPEYMMLLNI
jgi:hypothetical protein